MINFPNPFTNWSVDLNQGLSNLFDQVRELIVSRVSEVNFMLSSIMQEIINLKEAVARNSAGIESLSKSITEIGVKLSNESQEIKQVIDSLKDKINVDVAGIQKEVDTINASSDKLSSVGEELVKLGDAISNLVTPEEKQEDVTQ